MKYLDFLFESINKLNIIIKGVFYWLVMSHQGNTGRWYTPNLYMIWMYTSNKKIMKTRTRKGQARQNDPLQQNIKNHPPLFATPTPREDSPTTTPSARAWCMNGIVAGSNHKSQILGFHPGEKVRANSRQHLQQGSIYRHWQVQLVKIWPRVFTPESRPGAQRQCLCVG